VISLNIILLYSSTTVRLTYIVRQHSFVQIPFKGINFREFREFKIMHFGKNIFKIKNDIITLANHTKVHDKNILSCLKLSKGNKMNAQNQ